MKNPKAPIMDRLEESIDLKIDFLDRKIQMIEKLEDELEELNNFFPIYECYKPTGIVKIFNHLKKANYYFTMFCFNSAQIFVMLNNDSQAIYDEIEQKRKDERDRRNKSRRF